MIDETYLTIRAEIECSRCHTRHEFDLVELATAYNLTYAFDARLFNEMGLDGWAVNDVGEPLCPDHSHDIEEGDEGDDDPHSIASAERYLEALQDYPGADPYRFAPPRD
jgi:hypothetical protein